MAFARRSIISRRNGCTAKARKLCGKMRSSIYTILVGLELRLLMDNEGQFVFGARPELPNGDQPEPLNLPPLFANLPHHGDQTLLIIGIRVKEVLEQGAVIPFQFGALGGQVKVIVSHLLPPRRLYVLGKGK